MMENVMDYEVVEIMVEGEVIVLDEGTLDNLMFCGTYIYNGVNVKIDGYNFATGEIEFVSEDERPLDKDGSMLVTLTMQDFVENYYLVENGWYFKKQYASMPQLKQTEEMYSQLSSIK